MTSEPTSVSSSDNYNSLLIGQKRKAQNRRAQKAFRQRREQLQRNLESEIAGWQSKHEKLVKSYEQQCQEILRLKTKVKELKFELEAQSDMDVLKLWL